MFGLKKQKRLVISPDTLGPDVEAEPEPRVKFWTRLLPRLIGLCRCLGGYGLIMLIVSAMIGVFFLWWWNRTSKEMTLACLAMTTACIGLAGEKNKKKIALTFVAFLGGAATIYFWTTPEIHNVRYQKTYAFEVNTRTPLHHFNLGFVRVFFGGYRMTQSTAKYYAEAVKLAPSEFEDKDPKTNVDNNNAARSLYENIAFRQLLDILNCEGAWFAQHTTSEVVGEYEYSTGTSLPAPPSMVRTIKTSVIQQMNPSNPLISVFFPHDLHVPKGCEVSLNGNSITFRDGFIDMTLTVVHEGWWIGGLGRLGDMISQYGKPPGSYDRMVITVEMSAKLSRWKKGHPDMSLYRDWIERLQSQMDKDFNTQRSWIDAKEMFFLEQQTK